MSIHAEQPSQILQVYRDFLKPGSETAYQQIENDAARICVERGCPHPYVGMESLTGAKEVWFLNGHASSTEQKQVAADYTKNAPLLAALAEITKRKQGLIREPVEVFANYRSDLSRGRFLVVTVTKGNGKTEGTVFETQDGTRLIFTPAQSLHEAQVKAAARGSEAIVFAVRPNWSMPAKGWVAADPPFWKSRPALSK